MSKFTKLISFSYFFQHFWDLILFKCIMQLLPLHILMQFLQLPVILVSAFNIPNFLVDNVFHSHNCFFFLVSAFNK